jgi:hypothetical protein
MILLTRGMSLVITLAILSSCFSHGIRMAKVTPELIPCVLIWGDFPRRQFISQSHAEVNCHQTH